MTSFIRKFARKAVPSSNDPTDKTESTKIVKPEVKRKIIKHSSQTSDKDDNAVQLKTDKLLHEYTVDLFSPTDVVPRVKEITNIEFTFLTSSEIAEMSLTQIKQSKLTGENGVYDPRLGTINNHEKCLVCSEGWRTCPGHPGHIQLPVGIPHPIRLRQMAEYLTCVCGFCHRLIITKSQMTILGLFKYKKEHRFRAFLKHAEKIVRCPRCFEPHGRYIVIDDKFFKHYKKKSEIKRIPVTYDEVIEIVNNIREMDFGLLGFSNPLTHPIHMIIHNLYVLPTCTRTPIENGGGTMHDDLTYKFIEITKISSKLKEKNLPEKTRSDLIDSLSFHIKTLMDNSKNKARDPGGRRSIKSIKQRIAGKKGLIRGNMQGKRCSLTARTVASPDPDLHVGEVGIPKEIADKLIFPERVNDWNIDYCQQLLDTDRVNCIIRGEQRIDARFALWTRGFKFNWGDKVVRDEKILIPDDNFNFKQGDQVLRTETLENGEKKQTLIRGVQGPRKKSFPLMIGDTIERKLKDGDVVLLNRQPTLHEPSLRAKRIKIHPGRTITTELASTQAFNLDYDGDENNIFPAVSYETKAEYIELMSDAAQFINAADSKPMHSLKQDAMIAGYVFTLDRVSIPKHWFTDACCKLEWDVSEICNKMDRIRAVHKFLGLEKIEEDKILQDLEQEHSDLKEELKILKLSTSFRRIRKSENDVELVKLKNKCQDISRKLRSYKHNSKLLSIQASDNLLYTGYGLFSMLLPDDFEYFCDNKAHPKKEPIRIRRGTMISGTLNKVAIGSSSGSLIHHLYKDYGPHAGCDFITHFQRTTNLLLSRRGFSVGLEDCIPRSSKLIQAELQKGFTEARIIMASETDPDIKEGKLLGCLNQATSVGDQIAKEALRPDNNFVSMIVSGAKGSMFNITQITSAIGQQNLEGKRVPINCMGRTIPCYDWDLFANIDEEETKHSNDSKFISRFFQARGFILSSFYQGLEPSEFFFLSAGGREGLIDTSIRTAKCGYLSRRMLKMMEGLKISYFQNVVNDKGNIVQFVYGEDGFNGAELIKTDKGYQCMDIGHMVDILNSEYEWEETLPVS